MLKLKRYIPFFLIFLLQLLVFSASQFIAWPEMLYEPYLMNNGFLIYKDITIAHSPLLLFLLQLWFRLFNDYVLALRIFTFILTFLTGLLVKNVSVKIFHKENLGYIAWIIYIILNVYFEGNGVWFDHLVALWALLSFYFFYLFLFKINELYYIALAGLFLGFAGISKQTAGWLVLPSLFGFVLLLRQTKNFTKTIRDGFIFSVSCLLPFALTALYLYSQGAIKDVYFWWLHFGITVLPRSEGQISFPTFRQAFGTFLFFIPLVPYLLRNLKKKPSWFIALWTVFGFFGIYPRFERFHFQPALPLLSMISAFLISSKEKKSWIYLNGFIYFLLVVRFFINSFNLPVRFYEQDVQETVTWLKTNTYQNQRIYVYNTWDHFYALADRKAAVYPVPPTLKWYLEVPGLQTSVVESLKKYPESIIVMESFTSKGLGSYVPPEINEFITSAYEPVATISGRFTVLERN